MFQDVLADLKSGGVGTVVMRWWWIQHEVSVVLVVVELEVELAQLCCDGGGAEAAHR